MITEPPIMKKLKNEKSQENERDDQDVQDETDEQDEQDEQEPDEQNEHKIWHNLGLEDLHAWARLGKHVTKLISFHSLYTKNISSKFHQNLMNQIQDILL